MSERRTSEVKFRCTPSFKAALQSAADAAGRSLTEYIESAVWAHQNVKSEYDRIVPMIVKHDWTKFGRIDGTVGSKDSAAIVVNDAVPGCKGNCRPWEFCACKAAE